MLTTIAIKKIWPDKLGHALKDDYEQIKIISEEYCRDYYLYLEQATKTLELESYLQKVDLCTNKNGWKPVLERTLALLDQSIYNLAQKEKQELNVVIADFELKEQLSYNTGYTDNIVTRLFHKTTKLHCFSIVFYDSSPINVQNVLSTNTEHFIDQLVKLQELQRGVNLFAAFMSKEPGRNDHYICGALKNKSLFILNPLGETKEDCYLVLLKLKQNNIIENFYFNRINFQNRALEGNGLVSCGPIAAELALHFFSLSKDQFEDFWSKRDNNPLVKHSSGLEYRVLSLEYLFSTLQQLRSFKSPAKYQSFICQIRKKHIYQIITAVQQFSLQEIFGKLYLDKIATPSEEEINRLFNEFKARLVANPIPAENVVIPLANEQPISTITGTFTFVDRYTHYTSRCDF